MKIKINFFDRSSPARLVLLTVLLAALYFLRERPLSPEERRLYHKIEAAQSFLWEELGRRGLERDEGADPYHSGFIGLEWSLTTTTLGSLESKRCSTDPLWGVQVLRWFDRLGLQKGDSVTVLASSSFPGLVYSVLAAAEERGLKISLGVSLGSSTWGANRPELPWPVLAAALRRAGFLKTRPVLYTLGGDDENGGGLSQEARELLTAAARDDGLDPLRNATLEEAIKAKMLLVREGRLTVSVGGSEGNLGTDPVVLRLAPGLIAPRTDGGDGVIGQALKEGCPVIHLLNLRGLADACGIAWGARRPDFLPGRSRVGSALGLAFFILVLATHRRWAWEPEP